MSFSAVANCIILHDLLWVCSKCVCVLLCLVFVIAVHLGYEVICTSITADMAGY